MMKRPALFLVVCGLTLLGGLPGARATSLPPASAATPSTVETPLSGVPTPADIDAAALSVTEALGGVLRNCPAAYAAIGTPDKRCVGATGDVETLRGQISAALSADLYGVWRSRDDQRTVFNWLKLPSGTVYLRIASDEGAPGRSLIYLDAPTVPASAVTTPTPAASKPAAQTTVPAMTPVTGTATPAPKLPAPTATTFQATSPSADGTAARKTAPAAASPAVANGPAFSRTLQLATPRLNGPDVRAVQNRLIALTLGGPGGQGDGWYGPNTAKTVRDFQSANKLKATGVVDRTTWSALFSANAKKFKAAGK